MMQLTSLSVDRAGGLLGQEAGQRQAEGGQRAGVEEIAAGQAVAEGNGARGVQPQHTEGLHSEEGDAQREAGGLGSLL